MTRTPSTQCLDSGRWLFSETQNSGVLLTGTTSDRSLAAAYVREEHLASQELDTFTFAADGARFNRAAIRQHSLDQAQRYQAQARP